LKKRLKYVEPLNGVPVCSIQKYQRVQNNAARIVLKAPRRHQYHAKPLMRQLYTRCRFNTCWTNW